MSFKSMNLLGFKTADGDVIAVERSWSSPDSVVMGLSNGRDYAVIILTFEELAKLAHDLTTIVHQRRLERTDKYLGQLTGGL